MKSDNEYFVPYFVVEEYFKRKYMPDFLIINNFKDFLASYFNVDNKKMNVYINNRNCKTEIEFWPSDYHKQHQDFYEVKIRNDGYINAIYYVYSDIRDVWSPKDNVKTLLFKKTKEALDFSKFLSKKYEQRYYRDEIKYNKLPTNDVNFSFNITVYEFSKISLELIDNNSHYRDTIYTRCINAEGCEQFINEKSYSDKYEEEDIAKILIGLKIDIRSFSKDEQEQIKQLYISLAGILDEENEKKVKEFRELQVQRIMLAYQKFKEAVELLNDTKMDLKFEKVNVQNLKNIIFKNNGIPTEKGYVEFDDFFRNNMILRMLDLSGLDLTNVNITNMDFSGTNIHIDPQKIYNKDMTGVNAIDVHFSPFSDRFDDVILDGAKINDWEAMIDLNKVKSYNDQTFIGKEVVSYFY